MSKTRKVKAVKDESGDWYLIPNEYLGEFNEYQEQFFDAEWDDVEEFEEKFSKFKTGGCLNNTQLHIEDNRSIQERKKMYS